MSDKEKGGQRPLEGTSRPTLDGIKSGNNLPTFQTPPPPPPAKPANPEKK